jgi:hypothetical protein
VRAAHLREPGRPFIVGYRRAACSGDLDIAPSLHDDGNFVGDTVSDLDAEFDRTDDARRARHHLGDAKSDIRDGLSSGKIGLDLVFDRHVGFFRVERLMETGDERRQLRVIGIEQTERGARSGAVPGLFSSLPIDQSLVEHRLDRGDLLFSGLTGLA